MMVPGETVVVEKSGKRRPSRSPARPSSSRNVVTETVEVPGETVTVEVVKEVQVPGETVVVEKKEVVKTVEVPGQTVVVEKEVVKTVEVPRPRQLWSRRRSSRPSRSPARPWW